MTVKSYIIQAPGFPCDLYYKHVTIVNDDSRVVNKLETSLTDDARVVNCDYHMFIVQVFVPKVDL
jgi:hypothetical protein